MRKFFVLLVLLSFASCQKKETQPVAKPAEDTLETADLYSKVYHISNDLKTEDCTAFNDGCDCCDGQILFMKNGTFISQFYCIPDEFYTTGTFKIENNKLILDYDDKEAVYGPPNDTSPEGESFWRIDTNKLENVSINAAKCKNKYVFKNDESDYYSEDKKTPFIVAVNQYKRKGVWKLLNVKE